MSTLREQKRVFRQSLGSLRIRSEPALVAVQKAMLGQLGNFPKVGHLLLSWNEFPKLAYLFGDRPNIVR